ncbi:MAG: VWA domain-containing protein [Alphaproteobacteria bacterium]|nr:VWA domain-containing protein [Alphaproteobacteria bacterium]
MDENDLYNLFGGQKIPAFDDNRRKETLNLAVAAFEKSKKNQKFFQGFGVLSRLIGQDPTNRRNEMSFSRKKIIYGGLATACVALLVYSISPMDYLAKDSGAVPRSSSATLNKMQFSPDESSQDVSVMDKLQSLGSSPAEKEIVNMAGLNRMRANADAAPASAPAMSVVQGGVVGAYESGSYISDQEIGRDKFSHEEQSPIKQVAQEPVSTFSIDVDTASYAFIRQSLDNGVLPQPDAVRIEEMVNYFDYAYPKPVTKEEPFKASISVKNSPWNEGRKLVTVGIKGFDVDKTEQLDSNLVFLLDTSGSMDDPKKLPLLKQSLSMLLDSLKPTDKVSIVVYAGAAGTVLPPTEVSNKSVILSALQNLQAGGSTAGGEGIRLAYQLAKANFNPKAVNRVILATDGDFNVGITDPDELKGFIERERESGVFLSVLGFGTGNYNDDMMQRLAQNGNGVAAYIDTLNEARKVLVQEASAALFTIAKDVKIQVEFNPKTVSEYRLVGYETRALKTEDFNNDKVDAGDIGAGAEVTAIYEVTPVGGAKAIDDSRYAPKPQAEALPAAQTSQELGFLKIRYKLPNESTSKLITTPITPDLENVPADLARETGWAEAVAGFAQLLKGGKYTGHLTYDDVLKLAEANKGEDKFGYRAEFINLVYKAKTAASMPSQGGMPYQGPAGGGGVVIQPYPLPATR